MKTRYFAGVREQDLRIVFTRLGKRRALYASWRPQYHSWECEFRGYGIHCEPCFVESQFVVESIIRLKESISPEHGWKWLQIYKGRHWDKVPDPAAPFEYYSDFETPAEHAARAAREPRHIRTRLAA